MKIDFLNEAKKYFDVALNDLCETLKYKSVLDKYEPNSITPFGIENKKCLDFVLSMGKRDGFDTLNVDNYAGHISYGTGDIIGVLGHLDVVPAVGNWTNDPFTPTISDGKLFARGTLDDKGGVIASYYAIKMIKDLNLPISKQIRLIVGCDEESGSRCVERYFSKQPMPLYAFSPDAEFPLIYGEKGILSFNINGSIENKNVVSIKAGERYNIVCDEAHLEVLNPKQEYLDVFLKEYDCKVVIKDNEYIFYGKSAHAMQPHLGKNAIYYMSLFMEKYYPCQMASFIVESFDNNGEKLGIYVNDKYMHELTVNLGICHYNDKKLVLGYNLRVPLDEHIDVIKEGFNNGLEEYSNLSLGEFSYSPRHFVDPNSDFIKTLMTSYQEITNDYETKPFTIGGGTYARIMKNAVAYGPNFLHRDDLCHQPDEHIYLSDFILWIAIYAKAIYELAK